MKNLFIGLVFSLLFFSVLSSKGNDDSSVVSGESNEGSHGGSGGGDDKRKVSVNVNTDQAKIVSETQNGTNRNSFECDINANSNDHISFEMKFFARTTDTRAKFQYIVRFTGIIEYKDVGADNGFGTGDTIVQDYQFGDDSNGFEPIQYEQNATLTVLTIKTGDGVFTLTVRIAEEALTVGAIDLTPDIIEVDVEIENFPFKGTNSSGLALIGRLQSSTKTEKRFDDDTGATNAVDLADQSGSLSWITDFSSDGVTKKIMSSDLEDDSSGEDSSQSDSGDNNSVKISWSFTGGATKKILWDPTIGVNTSDGKKLVYGFLSILGLLAFLL